MIVKGEIMQKRCFKCQNKLHKEWLYCPICGSDVKKTKEFEGYEQIDLDRLLPEMVTIKAGEYGVGSLDNSSEEKYHKIYLDEYEISKYPITIYQWLTFLKHSKYEWGCEAFLHFKEVQNDYPALYINWHDAKHFCDWLTTISENKYSLPSEAQWEVACLSGSSSRFCFGDDVSLLEQYSWYDVNSECKPHSVGQKKPNQYGIFDMHGLVWEWCEDWYDDKYYSSSNYKNPICENNPYSVKILRGGAWFMFPKFLRGQDRYANNPDYRMDCFGFRVVQNSIVT